MSRNSPNSYNSEQKGSESLEGKGKASLNSGVNYSGNDSSSEKSKYSSVQEKTKEELHKNLKK